MVKELFIDLETTGLIPTKNAIAQVAGRIRIDGMMVEEFNFYCCPLDIHIIEPKALEANKISFETLKGGMPYADAYNKIRNMFSKYVDKFDKRDKMFFIGYNSRFDLDFIRGMFEFYGNKYLGSYIWFPPIDVMNMAIVKLRERRPYMTDFKLSTVAAELNLIGDDTNFHDAMFDIDMTEKMYNLLR